MSVQINYDPAQTFQQPVYQQVVREMPETIEEEVETRESCFSKITGCFTGCFSCCGSSEEAEAGEYGEIAEENFAQRWWNPRPYGKHGAEDSQWVRGEHVFAATLASLNTVAKVFFTVLSFIPGSSSESVEDNIVNIDKKANEGFDEKFGARQILPFLFTALAVTVNPYARVERNVSATDCLARKVFEAAVEYATVGIQRGIGARRYADDSGVKELLLRNVVSRFLFLTSTVLYVAEKIVHLAIGVILTACAAATLFRDEDLNTQARKYLGALDVVDHVCVGLRATLYPWQDLGKFDLSNCRDPLPSIASRERHMKTL